MIKQQKRRKLDQFLHESRKDPEVALAEMTRLSNKMWRICVGIAVTSVFIALLYPGGDWKRFVGVGSILFMVNGLGWIAILRIEPRLFDRPARFNRFIISLLVTVVASKLIFHLGWSPFLAPLPVLGMVLGMAYGPAVGLLVVTGLGFYLSFISPRMWGISIADVRAALENQLSASGAVDNTSLQLLMYDAHSRIDIILGLSLVLGGVVALLGTQRIRQQSRPALIGALAGVAQALVVLAFEILDPDFNYRDLGTWAHLRGFLEAPGWAFLGGLISGGLVTIFLPLIERVFGLLTERRLLALADPNNELLKTLRNRAPGTYQHTLGVAQLASAAAEAIGADALLCQVGAYYHDIGKIVKPEYFVENMGEDKSIHSRLRPSMSKLIIISHVKEGIELAQEAKLPPRIVDMIPMHHGTTVVEYFFHKAREQSNGETRESESEYRYPGPRPRFKEAGILMLADAVEAIAKSITDPTPVRFQTMVKEVIRKRLHDGQLDQCNLTIRDLRQIEESFVRTLTNMYHGRIRYPSNGSALNGDAGERDAAKTEPSRGSAPEAGAARSAASARAETAGAAASAASGEAKTPVRQGDRDRVPAGGLQGSGKP